MLIKLRPLRVYLVSKRKKMPLIETECSPAKTIGFILFVLTLLLRTLM